MSHSDSASLSNSTHRIISIFYSKALEPEASRKFVQIMTIRFGTVNTQYKRWSTAIPE